MTATDPRLGEIEAKVENHKKSPGGTYGPGSDIAYLLAELRKAQDALGRVEGLARSAAPMEGVGGMYSGIVLATHVLAAITTETGVGND